MAGAIPLVRALRESLTGERIHRVMGIVNGTTNFILTKMAEQGADYADGAGRGPGAGLAERDPTADVEGFDAAAKAAILAGVAFGYDVSDDDVLREGITGIGAADVDFADRLGYVVKLLAVVERVAASRRAVGPGAPGHGPDAHPLAGVRDAFNAVFIEGEAAGELMLYGQGAGGLPTASAVVGDLIDAARNLLAGTTAPGARPAAGPPRARRRSRGRVLREPRRGRPARRPRPRWPRVFGDHGVSIRSMEQDGLRRRGPAGLRDPRGPRGRRAGHPGRPGGLDAVERIGGVMRIVGAS